MFDEKGEEEVRGANGREIGGREKVVPKVSMKSVRRDGNRLGDLERVLGRHKRWLGI